MTLSMFATLILPTQFYMSALIRGFQDRLTGWMSGWIVQHDERVRLVVFFWLAKSLIGLVF